MSTPRTYRVSVLGSRTPRYFDRPDRAVDFAWRQTLQAWNDPTWTVWKRQDDGSYAWALRVNRDGHAERNKDLVGPQGLRGEDQ